MARRRANREGSIFKRQDGRWAGEISLPADGSGRTSRRTIYGRTRGAVLEKLEALKAEIAQGILGDPERATLADYLEHWLEHTQRPRIEQTTFIVIKGQVKNYIVPRLGRYRIDRLRPEHIDILLSDMEKRGKSARLRQHVRAVLHTALKDAVRRRRIAFNPVEAVARPKAPRREVQPLTAGDAHKVLAAAEEDHQLYALVAIALSTGARQGELFALRWSDVDLRRGTLHIRRAQREVRGKIVDGPPKTKQSRRSVALGRLALDALRRHRSSLGAIPMPQAPLFQAQGGARLRRSNFIRRTWRPLLERAGLPYIGFHAATRHTMASLALEQNLHPKIVQERLGHSRIGTTLDIYSHCLPGLQQGAADVLDDALQSIDSNSDSNAGGRPRTSPDAK